MNIMLLYDTPSLLVSSLDSKFKEAGYEVTKSELDLGKLTSIKEKQDIIFIFADEDLTDNMNALVYVKDMATEKDIPVFAAGDEDEIRILEKVVPANLIKKSFFRPINVKDVAESIQNYAEDTTRLEKKTVLVVDDSGAMLRNVKGWLEDKYKVILANSGTMAIKYLASGKPDLLLLDYEMPVLDGKQVLQMIRSEVEFSDIPVIFLTSKSDKQSVLEVMSLKPEGYLLKTLPPEEIIKAVDDFFEKKRIEKIL